jgi:hypothetical protein
MPHSCTRYFRRAWWQGRTGGRDVSMRVRGGRGRQAVSGRGRAGARCAAAAWAAQHKSECGSAARGALRSAAPEAEPPALHLSRYPRRAEDASTPLPRPPPSTPPPLRCPPACCRRRAEDASTTPLPRPPPSTPPPCGARLLAVVAAAVVPLHRHHRLDCVEDALLRHKAQRLSQARKRGRLVVRPAGREGEVRARVCACACVSGRVAAWRRGQVH